MDEKEVITTNDLLIRITEALQESDNEFIQNLAAQLLPETFVYMGDDFYEIN